MGVLPRLLSAGEATNKEEHAMKKFINSQETITDEELVGLGLAYGDVLEVDGHIVMSRDLEDADRVTVVAYGGSGHEPAQKGFVGAGQHGEGGGVRVPMASSKETVGLIAPKLVEAIGLKSGDKAFVMINGCGATTMMEQLILYKDTVE